MNEKELLQAISRMMDEKLTPINDRLEKIEKRTFKIEITLENETNRNIQLLMEAQSLNAEKMKNIDLVLDDIESSILVTEVFARQHIRDMNIFKKKSAIKAVCLLDRQVAFFI